MFRTTAEAKGEGWSPAKNCLRPPITDRSKAVPLLGFTVVFAYICGMLAVWPAFYLTTLLPLKFSYIYMFR